jgi:drug/metabolite transporter (DMT)-like permease
MNDIRTEIDYSYNYKVYIALIIHTLISAGTYLVAKEAVAEMAPFVFLFYRFSLASIIFIFILTYRNQLKLFDKSQLPKLIFLSLLAYPINQGLFLSGIYYTLPTHAALLYATTPVWIYLISIVRHEEKRTSRKTVGIATALIGVVVFLAEKGLSMKFSYLLGDTMILIAVLSWSLYSVLGRQVVKEMGTFAFTGQTAIIGTAIYFPLGLILALKFDYSNVGIAGWGGLAYTAVLTSVGAYSIWLWAMKRFAPSKVAVFMNLQPVTAAVMAYFLIGERLSLLSIISGVVILIGVYITQRENNET